MKGFAICTLNSDRSYQLQPEKQVSTRSWWIKYGVQVALTTAEKAVFTACNLAIKVPVPTVMGKSTFTFDLAARSYVLRCPDMSFRMAMRRFIPMSSDIVKACESQDLVTVRDLLLRHKAGPNDLTEDYRPLLWVRFTMLRHKFQQ